MMCTRAFVVAALRRLVPAATAGFALAAHAQYPAKPITVVVPFTVGTGMDIVGRTLGQQIAQNWGQAVVIDNKPGASGNPGTEFVARATPDGYTLLLTGTSFGINPAIHKGLRYDAVRDFEPIVWLASATMSLLVTTNTSAQSVRELVELAKKKPGELNYGSPGSGTLHHVTTELFKNEAGIDMTHIPYKGTAGAINDVAGGRIDVMFMPVSVALPLVRSGPQSKARMIAILSAERSPLLPGVPTMKEAGYPNVHTEFWYGLFAPAGTPAPVVARVNGEMNTLLQSPAVKDVLTKQGMSPTGGAPSRLGELVKSEISRWIRVVKAANIKAD